MSDSTLENAMPADLREHSWCWVRFELSDGTPSDWMPARRSGTCMETPGWRTPNVVEFGPLIEHSPHSIPVGEIAFHPDLCHCRPMMYEGFDKLPAGTKLYTAPQQTKSPIGWQFVPVEPTPAMEIAGGIAHESSQFDDAIGPINDAWTAMLMAAPQQSP